jgi:hypothetical protein
MTVVPPVLVGPQCPHCSVALTKDWVQSGTILCPVCGRPFEATAFDPPERKPRAVAVVESFPEGANSCANHPANAAVTSCQRCGLFVCSLCDMNLGDGSLCPACFDRVRAEGALRGAATRYLDYGSMARLSALGGFLFQIFFLGIPIGALTIYYARKGAQQRREDGDSTVGMMFLVIIGILEILAGVALFGFMVWAMVQAADQ